MILGDKIDFYQRLTELILNLKDKGLDFTNWKSEGTINDGNGPFRPGVDKSEVYLKKIKNEELSSFLETCEECGFVLCEKDIYIDPYKFLFKEQNPITIGVKINDSHSLLNGKTCICLYLPTFETFIKNKEKNGGFGENSPERFKTYYKELMYGYRDYKRSLNTTLLQKLK